MESRAGRRFAARVGEPIWQSSQRPLFVRTVWVDGFRHALLDGDDPAAQRRCRPASSNVYGGSRRMSAAARPRTAAPKTDELLTDCFVKFNIEPPPKHNFPLNTHAVDIETLISEQITKTKDDDDLKTTVQTPAIRAPEPPKKEIYKKQPKLQDDYDDERFCERVLQWVDTARKRNSITIDHRENPHPAITETFVRPTINRQQLTHRRINVDEFATIYRWEERRIIKPNNAETNASEDDDKHRENSDDEEMPFAEPIYFENAPRTKLHVFVPSLSKNILENS